MYYTHQEKVEGDILKSMREFIRSNDVENLRRALTKLTHYEKEKLIATQCMDSSNRFSSGSYRHSTSALKKPCPVLFEAVQLGNIACVKLLLQNGFNMESRDTNGWNILHYLIAVSYFNPPYETTAVGIWKNIENLLNSTQMENVLKAEDMEGLRPVEMALHLGCILLFNEIINTPIYLSGRKQIALWEQLTYDVTDYERCGCIENRRSKNLVQIAAHVDRKVLTREQSVTVLRSGMLRKWVHSKLMINLLPICIWFALRFFQFVSFFIIISSDVPLILRRDKSTTDIKDFLYSLNFTNLTTEKIYNDTIDQILKDNQTYSSEQKSELREKISALDSLCQPRDWYTVLRLPGVYNFFFYFLFIYSIAAVLYDVTEMSASFCRGRYRWRFAFRRNKTLVVASTYYRTCQFLFSLLVLFWFLLYIEAPHSWASEYGIILTCFLSVWSFLYFLQIIPSIGPFINSIQQMLTIMVQFLIVYFIVLLPYPHAFLVLVSSDTKCDTEGFESIGQAIYTTFKAMLNMVDFDKSAPDSFGAVHILHIIYVFTVAILLVNFLIALLSAAVGETVEAADVIMMLQRLSVVSAIEGRCCTACPAFYRLMHRLVYKCENERIYLQYSVFLGVKKEQLNQPVLGII